jgi:hypothetical protein
MKPCFVAYFLLFFFNGYFSVRLAVKTPFLGDFEAFGVIGIFALHFFQFIAFIILLSKNVTLQPSYGRVYPPSHTMHCPVM